MVSGAGCCERLCMTKFASVHGVELSVPLVAWIVTSVVFVISIAGLVETLK